MSSIQGAASYAVHLLWNDRESCNKLVFHVHTEWHNKGMSVFPVTDYISQFVKPAASCVFTVADILASSDLCSVLSTGRRQ